jgi:hypothetical protein
MSRKVFSVIFLLVTAGAILLLNGCSLACTGLGALEDSRAPDIAGTVPGSKLEKVKVGSQIIVNLKDGNYVCGKYAGIDTIPNEKYDEEYAELQKQMPEGSFLPSIGDTISCISKYGRHDDIKFLGFEEKNMMLSSIEKYRPEKLKLEYLIKIMDKYGNETKGEAINNLKAEGKFPSLFFPGISVEINSGEEDEWDYDIVSKTFIYINDIDQIQIKSRKYGKLIGCLSGAAIDGFLIFSFMMFYGSALSGGQ